MFRLFNSVMDPAGLQGSSVPPMTPVPMLVASTSASTSAPVVSTGAPSTQAATSAQAVVSQPSTSTSTASATVRLRLTPNDLSSIAMAVAGILGPSPRNPLSTTTSAPSGVAQAPPKCVRVCQLNSLLCCLLPHV